MHRRARATEAGFTLIEILVVTVIIGIVAAIAIPVFLSHRGKAIEASQKSDARSLAVQMESSFTDANGYPTSLQLVDAGPDGGGRVVFTTLDPTDTEEFVSLSPNNSAEVHLAADVQSFCVVISSGGSEQPAVYKSANGGLQAVGASECGPDFQSFNIVG